MQDLITKKNAQGFTLVEIAVVLVIIGVLMLASLQGASLIRNARTTATVTQMKNIKNGTQLFNDTYPRRVEMDAPTASCTAKLTDPGFMCKSITYELSIPGDMTDPSEKLPNCSSAPCSDSVGNGNGALNNALNAAVPPGSEGGHFFIQLAAAGLHENLQNNMAKAGQWGGIFPAAKVGGGFVIGNVTGLGSLTNPIGSAAPFTGLTLAIVAQPTGNLQPAMWPMQAAQIDRKIDDGQADEGKIRAFGTASATGCANSGVYNESRKRALCGLYYNIPPELPKKVGP